LLCHYHDERVFASRTGGLHGNDERPMTQSNLTLSNLSANVSPEAGFLATLRQTLQQDGAEGELPIELMADGKTLLVDGQMIDAEAMLADGMFSEAEMAQIADMTAMEEGEALLARLNQAAATLNGKDLPIKAGSELMANADNMTEADKEALNEKALNDKALASLQEQVHEDSQAQKVSREALLETLSRQLPDDVDPEQALAQLSPDQLAALVAQVRANQQARSEASLSSDKQGMASAQSDKAMKLASASIPWAEAKAGADETEKKGKESVVAKDVAAALAARSADNLDKQRQANQATYQLHTGDGESNSKSSSSLTVQLGQAGANALASQQAQAAGLSKAALQTMTGKAANADKAAGVDGSGSTRSDTLMQQLANSLGTPSAQAHTARQDMQAAQNAQAPLPMGQTPADAGAALSERVNVMLSKNLKQVDIRLDPPELGRMQIKLGINNDQATVHITVANHQARDLVEQAMPRLREMLQQQGLQLAQGSVQQQDSGAQQMASGQQQHSGAGQSSGAASGMSGLDDGVDEVLTSQTIQVSHSDRAVDYYA
jgi:flagellar hook-length control protein FliK